MCYLLLCTRMGKRKFKFIHRKNEERRKYMYGQQPELRVYQLHSVQLLMWVYLNWWIAARSVLEILTCNYLAIPSWMQQVSLFACILLTVLFCLHLKVHKLLHTWTPCFYLTQLFATHLANVWYQQRPVENDVRSVLQIT